MKGETMSWGSALVIAFLLFMIYLFLTGGPNDDDDGPDGGATS